MEKIGTTTEIVKFNYLVTKFEEKQKKLSLNPVYAKEGLKHGNLALEKLLDLRKNRIISVDLEVPKEFVEKLATGEVIRTAGVLRKNENYAIAKHLKEAKPTNVKQFTKVVNAAFMAVDILEAVLVEQKLHEILSVVKDIDAKLDAQNLGALHSAFEQMKELHLIKNQDIKAPKILFLQEKLSYCEHLFLELYQYKWEKYQKLKLDYNAAHVYNQGELEEIRDLAQQLPHDLTAIILCKVGQIKLYEMQEEIVAAQEKAFNLTEFAAVKLKEFENEFGNYGIYFQGAVYKNPLDFRKKRTLENTQTQLIEAREHMEHLLNTSVSYALTIPELIVKDRLSGWLGL